MNDPLLEKCPTCGKEVKPEVRVLGLRWACCTTWEKSWADIRSALEAEAVATKAAISAHMAEAECEQEQEEAKG